MERIAASPRSAHDLAASKKHVSPNHREEERPTKRSKMDVALAGGDELSFRPRPSDIVDAEEERLVEFNLLEQGQSTPSPTVRFDVDQGPTPLSKKRKRVVFDGVEVPSVRQVYSRAKDTLPVAFATPPKQSPTKTRSTAKPAHRNLRSVSRKRRRDSDEGSEDPFSGMFLLEFTTSVLIVNLLQTILPARANPHPTTTHTLAKSPRTMYSPPLFAEHQLGTTTRRAVMTRICLQAL
jgi:hypothetical protein